MLHTIALTQLRGITQAQSLELLRTLGTVQPLFEAPDEALAQCCPQVRNRIVAAIAEHKDRALDMAARELEFCAQKGIEPLPITAEAYPRRLAECADAPALLYYRGNRPLNAQRVLSVVGTRRITDYGKDLCHQLVADLARLCPDVLVVSGLAYGVDIHAHRACLAQGVSTVGVLAHGLDQIYPSSHRHTAVSMTEQGGLLTEYASGTRPLASHFVRRNRIVAGMADATLVVESADKGGALITAGLAHDYSRPVAAFPGRTTDPYSAGCLKLIREQRAEMVTSVSDLLSLLGWTPSSSSLSEAQLSLFPECSPSQEKVVEALHGSEGLSAAQLSAVCQLPLSELNEVLFELEMSGRLRLLAGGRYRLLSQA